MCDALDGNAKSSKGFMNTAPNPEWKSSPYEVSGACEVSQIGNIAEDAAKRLYSFTITVQSVDPNYGLTYHLKENIVHDESRHEKQS